LLEKQQIEQLVKDDLACEANIIDRKVTTKPGKKYTKVDIGRSGAYMIVDETSKIFGISAYGVIHRGHYYGTLDTINDYYWGNFGAYKIKTS